MMNSWILLTNIYCANLCRVGCKRSGSIRFTINGRDYFELVLISNVGGVGEIARVWIKGSKMSNWESMSRNWGVNWQSLSYLNGQVLSFRVQLSDGSTRTAYNVAPSNWRFGQSFISNVQFWIEEYISILFSFLSVSSFNNYISVVDGNITSGCGSAIMKPTNFGVIRVITNKPTKRGKKKSGKANTKKRWYNFIVKFGLFSIRTIASSLQLF